MLFMVMEIIFYPALLETRLDIEDEQMNETDVKFDFLKQKPQ